ncbi:MAG: hypothetical protein DMG57_15210 [Acidobacteria bacterium]|nr:MAG: hypothetical protein DMG57_15210 [Acidobacteriota bacterium]
MRFDRLTLMKAALVIPIALLCGSLNGRKFYDDDPLWREPSPLRVEKIEHHELSNSFDFFQNTIAEPGEKQSIREPIRAEAANTLGEVPDSAWYRNRDVRAAPLADLERGPGNDHAPSMQAPWQIIAAKTEGVTPGFRIKDASGRGYLVKFDPPDDPELATAADVVGCKFFYALSYNTPENYIVSFTREQLAISPKTAFRDAQGRKRPMKPEDVDRVLTHVPRDPQGRFRAMASLYISGDITGPFLYYGTRPDDPNDIVPHERRRDLRGLYVFAAWLNHTDAKSLNSLDTMVTENGLKYVKHYLIDFGAILGSGSISAKDVRAGNEYFVDRGPALARLFTLGIYAPDWERYHYPRVRGVGNFQAKFFNPNVWKTNYPNPAFDNRLPDDTYWAAKKVMEFSPEQIRTLVSTGEYSDPTAVDYITRTLVERQQKIGKVFFEKILPLDHFQVEGGNLKFEDLAVTYRFQAPRAYQAHWAKFDNHVNRSAPVEGATGFSIPSLVRAAADNDYFAVDITRDGTTKSMTVYLRRKKGRLEVVGIDRRW